MPPLDQLAFEIWVSTDGTIGWAPGLEMTPELQARAHVMISALRDHDARAGQPRAV